MRRKVLTLCIVHQHPHVLLGMKKRGFGQGRWNGFGGHVEDGETIEEAAVRELHEEAGVRVGEMQRLGILEFEHPSDEKIHEVHIFRAEKFVGEPRESDEMRPQWFHVDEIPFHEMWPDDEYWFPLFLEEKNFQGRIVFDEADNIIDMKLQEGEL